MVFMVKKVFIRRPLPRSTVINDPENQDVSSVDDDELPQGGNKMVVIVFIVLIVLGIGTGFLLSKKFNSPVSTTAGSKVMTTDNGKKSVGVSDTATFKDSATGTVQAGGSSGEGTHNLVRDGGPSQTVYLISSVVDLDQFVGKKVT